MITINSANMLQIIHKLYGKIGLEKEAEAFFTTDRFDTGVILRLPDVCLMPKNKPALCKGKQTHIHVTGDARFFFYPKSTIVGTTKSTDDKIQNLTVSKANIQYLNDKSITSLSDLGLVNSTTLTKIAARASQEAQVQLSKVSKDGSDFISLRSALYTGDLLVFLKYTDEDRYFALGIPYDFYNNTYELSNGSISRLGFISVKDAVTTVVKGIGENAMISGSEAIEDSIYQQLVDDVKDDTVAYDNGNYHAEVYTAFAGNKGSHSNRPKTNPYLGKQSIKSNGYKCIFSSAGNPHDTFLKPNGKLYMEAHHIIPMSKQSMFKNKLDTKANIVPVCPLCHRQLHHGQPSDVDKLLVELHTVRSQALSQSGISVALDDLKSFYH